jgi:hypothetical protein
MNFGGYSREKCSVGSEVQGSGFRGSGFKVQGSRFKVQGSRFGGFAGRHLLI